MAQSHVQSPFKRLAIGTIQYGMWCEEITHNGIPMRVYTEQTRTLSNTPHTLYVRCTIPVDSATGTTSATGAGTKVITHSYKIVINEKPVSGLYNPARTQYHALLECIKHAANVTAYEQHRELQAERDAIQSRHALHNEAAPAPLNEYSALFANMSAYDVAHTLRTYTDYALLYARQLQAMQPHAVLPNALQRLFTELDNANALACAIEDALHYAPAPRAPQAHTTREIQ